MVAAIRAKWKSWPIENHTTSPCLRWQQIIMRLNWFECFCLSAIASSMIYPLPRMGTLSMQMKQSLCGIINSRCKIFIEIELQLFWHFTRRCCFLFFFFFVRFVWLKFISRNQSSVSLFRFRHSSIVFRIYVIAWQCGLYQRNWHEKWRRKLCTISLWAKANDKIEKSTVI